MITAALWFHDAAEEEEDFEQEKPRVMTNDDNDDGYCCENCRKMDLQQEWEERQEFMQQYKYGLCIDCGGVLGGPPRDPVRLLYMRLVLHAVPWQRCALPSSPLERTRQTNSAVCPSIVFEGLTLCECECE